MKLSLNPMSLSVKNKKSQNTKMLSFFLFKTSILNALKDVFEQNKKKSVFIRFFCSVQQ